MSLQGLFDPIVRTILTRPYNEMVKAMIEQKPYGIKSNVVGEVADSAFSSCRTLTTVDFPNVISIGNKVFYYCFNLTSVNLPNVTSIGESAFEGCAALATIIVRTTSAVCTVDFSALSGTPIVEGKGHVYVPSSMYEYYRAGYEPALEAAGFTGFFDIMFRKIEDYPEICGTI